MALSNDFIIGIDPDAKKYGVAVYQKGKLTTLSGLDTVQMVDYIRNINVGDYDPVFAIENVKVNSFIYGRNQKNSQAINGRVAQNVGMCKHAQTVAEQFIEDSGYEIIRIKPQGGNWAKRRQHFEVVTGWNKQSNEDTRSAAYFGYMAYQQIKQENMRVK